MGVRYCSLGKEDTYGAVVAAVRSAEVQGNIEPDQNYNIPQPTTIPAYRKCSAGLYRARGTLTLEGEPSNILGDLLLGVLGSVETTNPGTGHYQHIFKGVDLLPSYTFRLGVEQMERVLPGCLVESLTMRFPHDGDLNLSAEILTGFDEQAAAIGAVPTISIFQSFNFRDTANSFFKMGFPLAEKGNLVYDAEITIRNNIPFDRGQIAGRGFPVKRRGVRTITGKLSLYFDDDLEYTRFKSRVPFIISAKASSVMMTDSNFTGLALYLGNCQYLRSVAPGLKTQAERLMSDAPFQAFRFADTQTDIRVTLDCDIPSF